MDETLSYFCKVARRRDLEDEVVQGREAGRKRVKMRDLKSVMCSQDAAAQNVEWPASSQVRRYESFRETKATSPDVDECITLPSAEEPVDSYSTTTSSSHVTVVGGLACSERDEKGVEPSVAYSEIDKKSVEPSDTKSLGLSLNLNVDVPNLSMKASSLVPPKTLDYLKDVEKSECRTYPAPRDEKESESMKIWKTMKQNGFISSALEKVPISKHQDRVKKHKKDSLQRKIDIAKKEQMNKFSKAAAPSGLLSGLNPGIINHVRNSKQVFAIIEALARPEKPMTRCSIEPVKVKEENSAEKVDYEEDKIQTRRNSPLHINNQYGIPILDAKCKRNVTDTCRGSSFFSFQYRPLQKIERLNLKLPSSSEKLSRKSSIGIPVCAESVLSLSVEAARAASQWLELLQQDLWGRLAAVKGSRSRLRDMTERELSFLFSKNPSSQQEEDNLSVGKPLSISQVHVESWQSIFSQLEIALSEEEIQLGLSLKQVSEMREHCDQGLQSVHPSSGPPHYRIITNDPRMSQADAYDRECAVQAAAASIYSTCNLVIR